MWKINIASMFSPLLTSVERLDLPLNSVSTPVISENGYVYAGWGGYDASFVGEGGIVGVLASAFSTFFDVYGNGAGTGSAAGDLVQSSPIVWTDAEETGDDFIYFTTNSGSGAGWCFRYGDTSTTPTQVWTAPNTSGNNYSLQGMAYSDSGYVVWGDDGDNLYVAP
jgi:hypothetical protein